MEEAAELANYLPLSFMSRRDGIPWGKTPKEQEYVEFLWDAFETNYSSKKHQFAFLAYHMLTMSFVYFNIWQIKQNRPADFLKATYGFSKDIEDIVFSATSPFTFSEIGESAIFRFLKLIDCDNGKIGTYTKLVKDRNASAHPNGVIHYADQQSLDNKIAETLRAVTEIQGHSKCVIEDCYRKFLLDSYDSEERQYPDATDQIREILVHEHYLSQKDIEICLGFNIASLIDHPHYAVIYQLHDALKAEYPTENDVT